MKAIEGTINKLLELSLKISRGFWKTKNKFYHANAVGPALVRGLIITHKIQKPQFKGRLEYIHEKE